MWQRARELNWENTCPRNSDVGMPPGAVLLYALRWVGNALLSGITSMQYWIVIVVIGAVASLIILVPDILSKLLEWGPPSKSRTIRRAISLGLYAALVMGLIWLFWRVSDKDDTAIRYRLVVIVPFSVVMVYEVWKLIHVNSK